MASERFKKIRIFFVGIIVVKLMMLLIFMYGGMPSIDIGVVSAIAKDDKEVKEEKNSKDKAVKEEKKEAGGGKAGGDEKKGKEGEPEPKPSTEPTPDPGLVLDGLEQKRKMLLEKEEQLKLEQERLDGIKKEIDEKLEKLSYTYRQIEEGLEKIGKKETESERVKREAEEAKMDQLVKVFSSMKPKKAAEIVNNMDLEVAKKLFLRMKGDRAGEILSFVNSDKAAQISEMLIQKKEMF